MNMQYLNPFDQFYKGGKTSADAVRLAISDHKFYSGTVTSEFIHALEQAATICDAYNGLRHAANEAAKRLRATNQTGHAAMLQSMLDRAPLC